MTISASTKIRAFGGASALALTAGLATAGIAQETPTAPAPVDAVPTPTAPAAPADAVECALDTVATPNTVICAPGTDADGITEALDDVVLTVQDGAQVQGQINLGAGTVATIDGDIIVVNGPSAVSLGSGSTVVNNGYLSANPFFDGIISVGDGSTATNNGIITTGTGNVTAGMLAPGSANFVNNGDIILVGSGTAGIVGNFNGVGTTPVSATNTVNGRIIVDNESGGTGFGIILFGDGVTVQNDGLIQIFGNSNFAIQVGDEATITNTGNIATSGDDAIGVLTGDNSTLDNSGSITTEGEDSDAIVAGDDFTLTNSGTISATGEDARGIEAGDNFTLTNSGTIEAADRAINAGDDATITNEEGGLINTTGDADTIQTGDNLTIVNNGTISNEGFDTKIIDAGDGLTVTNNGTITSDWKGIEGEDDFTLTNNEGGLIFSALDEAVEADGPGLVVVNDGEIIAPKDDAIDGGDNVRITNTGLIQGGENDGIELNSGTIINSGIIESLSSDPNGSLVIGGTVPELDAGIDFDATRTMGASEDGIVINRAGGIIIGDIGINTSAGNQDSPDTNDGRQEIYNEGTITGREGDAVLLGNGNDDFAKINDGIENGIVDGQAGNDDFFVVITDATDRTFDLGLIGTQYLNFERFGFGTLDFDPSSSLDLTPTAGTGILTLTGATALEIEIFNSAIIDGEVTGTVTLDDIFLEPILLQLIVTENGSIAVDDGDAIEVEADGFAIINAGTITATDGRAIDARGVDGTAITNSGTIEAFDRAIDAGDDVTITNEMGGLINTTGDDDTIQTGDNLTIVNNGTISNEGFDTKIIDAGDGLTVTNNGTITSDWKGIEGEDDFTLTNNEGGLIFSTNDEAVEADGPGLVVVNNGEIIAPRDDAIDGGADVTITNTGLIRGGENDGLELDSGTITNSGIIESLSSDPEGAFSDADFTNRELDAGIDFDGVDDPENLAGPATDTVTNLAGGIIRGNIGINASSGNFGEPDLGDDPSPANVRSQTIVNFGEITGNLVNPVTGRIDAVLLGAGDDGFQQWTGAVVNGWVDLEGGNDLFILEGVSSTFLGGGITGGEGDDTAILAGILDSDNIFSFETIQLGSQLGGTLNDLEVVGNRSLTGDLVHVGVVNVSLGVDSLTTTGSITLEETGVLNIATPLNQELLGQTVLVLQEGEGEAFTNNGATVNIIDNDLLLDYSVVLGSLSVQVNLVNPVANNPDANIASIGGAVSGGLTNGTLSDGAFTVLNNLQSAAAYSGALKDALPSLSDGVGREIFESGSLASQALDHHLKGESSGVWGQIAVRGASQDARSQSVDGYESNQLVFAVGGDIALGDSVRVGLMASYADIDVDDETATGAPTNSQEVKSTRIGVYAASTLFERGFVNAEIAYLTGDVTSARDGALGPIASAYDFDGFATRAVLGYDLLADENVSFTPTIGLNAARIRFDDAIEVGGFGFTVEQGDAEFLEIRFGLELGAQMAGGVNVFAQGVAVHDLIDDPRSLRLSSNQLTTFFVTQPVREQDRFELSAGASIDVSENFAIDLGYLGDFSDGYSAHSGRASVRMGF